MDEGTQPTCGRFPDSEYVELAVEVFALLADATRVRIILALRDAEELSVNHLADIVDKHADRGLAAPREDADGTMVTTRQQGQRVFYRLANEHAVRLVTDAIFQAEHSVSGFPRHHHPDHDSSATAAHDDRFPSHDRRTEAPEPARAHPARRTRPRPRGGFEAPHAHDHDGQAHPHGGEEGHGHGHSNTVTATPTAKASTSTSTPGVAGFLVHLFVPHTHDAADSHRRRDGGEQGRRPALLISLVVLLVTTLLQFASC